MLQHIQSGNELCVAVTILDGIVLARSAFHHSISYRSVVIFGTGSLVEDKQEKLEALQIIPEHVIPGRGRWKDVCPPSEKELKATMVVSMAIVDASAKVRVGIPNDEIEDYALPIWAVCIPLKLEALTPHDDPKLIEGMKPPEYAVRYERVHGLPAIFINPFLGFLFQG